MRPRGWHLFEKHMLVDGRPVPAGIFDFGLFFFHNAAVLRDKGSGPYFYLPKMESHLEARLWNSVFVQAQVLFDHSSRSNRKGKASPVCIYLRRRDTWRSVSGTASSSKPRYLSTIDTNRIERDRHLRLVSAVSHSLRRTRRTVSHSICLTA